MLQRGLRSAGGSVVPVPDESRLTGEELIPAASSVPVACRATAWTHSTTATVTLTAPSGTGPSKHTNNKMLLYDVVCFYTELNRLDRERSIILEKFKLKPQFSRKRRN